MSQVQALAPRMHSEGIGILSQAQGLFVNKVGDKPSHLPLPLTAVPPLSALPTTLNVCMSDISMWVTTQLSLVVFVHRPSWHGMHGIIVTQYTLNSLLPSLLTST